MLLLPHGVGRNQNSGSERCWRRWGSQSQWKCPIIGCWGCCLSWVVGCGCWCRAVPGLGPPASLLNAEGVSGCPGMGLPLWHLPRSLLFLSLAARGALPLRSRWGSLAELINEPEVLAPFIPCLFRPSVCGLRPSADPLFPGNSCRNPTFCFREQMCLCGCSSGPLWDAERDLGFNP